MSFLVALLGIVAALVALSGVKNENRLLAIGGFLVALCLLAYTALSLFGPDGDVGEQAIDKQYDLIREALPGWNAQKVVIVHHPGQADPAKQLSRAHSNAVTLEVPDPLNQDIEALTDISLRIAAPDFGNLVNQHRDADLLILLPGMPGGLRQAKLAPTQRLVIADLSTYQWKPLSRHPNVLAGVLAGDASKPGWHLLQTKKPGK